MGAQDQKPESGANAMPKMDMPGHSMSDMPGPGPAGRARGACTAMQAMENRHMDMGPHMKMTRLRHPQPGDSERAAEVAQAARKVAEKYTDYKTALADGFRIFLPNLPQKQYHFTNYRYASEASLHFNPDHPTSLLYEKQGDGYKLIGVMYTAPKNFSEDELNQRIPLSIAQWHAHVNLCLPPPDQKKRDAGTESRGLRAGRLDQHRGRLLRRGGKVYPPDLWLDGAYLSLRAEAS